MGKCYLLRLYSRSQRMSESEQLAPHNQLHQADGTRSPRKEDNLGKGKPLVFLLLYTNAEKVAKVNLARKLGTNFISCDKRIHTIH